MSATKHLVVLAEKFAQKIGKPKGEYGGKGPLILPASHKALLVLESGTFSCANCKFVNAEKHECGSPHFIEWNGGRKLPDAPLEKICSDWFEPKE